MALYQTSVTPVVLKWYKQIDKDANMKYLDTLTETTNSYIYSCQQP